MIPIVTVPAADTLQLSTSLANSMSIPSEDYSERRGCNSHLFCREQRWNLSARRCVEATSLCLLVATPPLRRRVITVCCHRRGGCRILTLPFFLGCIFLNAEERETSWRSAISPRDRVWGCWKQSGRAISLCSGMENRPCVWAVSCPTRQSYTPWSVSLRVRCL